MPCVLAQEPVPAAEAPAEELPPLLQEPALVEFVQATWPPGMEEAGKSATVRLLIEIDEAGAVTNVTVVTPAGDGFDEAATEAAKQFKFSPAVDATGPVPVALEFDYRFELAPPPEPPPEAVEAPINVEGTLQEMATRVPIANAAVQVLQGELVVGATTTDAEGRFSLRGVPPGELKLVAFGTDHQRDDVKITVANGEVTKVDMWLRRLSYRGAAIIGVYEKERPPEVTRRTLSIEEVRRVPGTFGDPVRVIQSLPGAARAPFSLGLLVLRGANPEDSNVYVDGVEVPLVYHLGGFRSILNPELVKSVDYLPGTYSAKYGRSTGGVIDVQSMDQYPDRPHFTLRTDFLDTGLYGEAKVGDKVGVAAGVRHSYLDLLLGVALANSEFYAVPRWFDYQLKVTALDLGDDELSLFVFGFQDDFIIRTDSDAEDAVGLHYSTHRIVARWHHSLTEDLQLQIQPSFGPDGTRFGFGSDIALEADVWRGNLRGALVWKPNDAFKGQFGLDSEGSRGDVSLYAASVPVDGDDPLSESEPVELYSGVWQFFPDPFLEVTLTPLKARERLVLVGGARLNALIRPEEAPTFAFDPRFGVRAEVVKGGVLKAGTGIYHQPPSFATLGATPYFERAWSSELGWEQKIGPVQADITGFYRDMQNLGGGDDPGIGRAYGMEVMVRHPLVNRFFGWVSYTLSRSERNDTPDDPEGWYPFDFDQTHILTAVAGYRLPLDFEASARAQYVTGNPYTPYAGGLYLMDEGSYIGFPSADTNSERQAPFYALDLRVSKLFTFKHWQLELFADVLNAVHGENPEFTLYNYDYTESASVSGLPTIPSLGFQVEVNL
jgi:TonB family protein